MLSEFNMTPTTTFDELNALRLEALDLLDRCLTEQTTGWMEAFIEQNITRNPPPVQLLSEVAEDVHFRLLGLQQFHFDLREQAIRTLREDHGLDLHLLLPPGTLDDYHRLDADQIVRELCMRRYLKPEDATSVRDVLRASVDNAQRVYHELRLTEHLYGYVMDWLNGLRILTAQHFWVGPGRTVGVQRVQ
jgi:hypothetical protein